MQEDLQESVDEIARLLGAPATLEDRSFQLLAYAEQSGDLDEVRRQSILRRRATPEVRAYFEGYGIASAPGPVRIPADGGKVIEELFGRASSGDDALSLAHMVAPPGWAEAPQTPSFGEITLVVRGAMRVEVGDARVDVAAGQAIWTEAGRTVRYSNPFDAESEYFAICIPAFTLDRAGR